MNLLVAVSSLAVLGAQSPSQLPSHDMNYLPAALHQQLVCAPQMLPSAPVSTMRVVGNDEPTRTLFGIGDGVIIDAGTAQGIKAGQQYFVRRVVNDQFIGGMTSQVRPVSIHTAGWLTVLEARDNMSIAQITQACDGIIKGDYLEPFADPQDPPATAEGSPDYDHAGRILMGDERHQLGSAGTLMVADPGGDAADVRPGQTVTIFRDTMGGGAPVYQVGRATVVSVRPDSAVIRIDSTRDAVYIGDRIAINRATK